LGVAQQRALRLELGVDAPFDALRPLHLLRGTPPDVAAIHRARSVLVALAALGVPAGALRRRPEARDGTFDAGASAPLGLELLVHPDAPLAVVALVQPRVASVQRQHVVYRAVEKAAVVGDEQEAALAGEVRAQPLAPRSIEVIGRLVH